MRRRLDRRSFAVGFTLAAVLFSAATAMAVNVTFVLSQAQVDIATWKWNQQDPSHATWATVQLFGADQLAILINRWKDERQAARRAHLGAATGYFCTTTWGALNTTQQNAVCTGVPLVEVTGCTPCSASGD